MSVSITAGMSCAQNAAWSERCLSGYAAASDRGPIAFSILFNGLERKHRAEARALQDDMAGLLAAEAARST